MQEDFQVIFIVVIGTLLLIFLVAFIVMSVYFYQRSQHKHLHAMEDLRNRVQKEILIAQLEIKEKTLNTIAQEIHDNIGQVLSLAKLNLNKVLITDTTADAEKINSTKDLIGRYFKCIHAPLCVSAFSHNTGKIPCENVRTSVKTSYAAGFLSIAKRTFFSLS